MHTFVISLPGTSRRRSSAINKLRELSFRWEIVDGVQASNWQPSALPWTDTAKSWLRVGDVGCYLAHLHAMQRILDYQLPWACVLEDDFCLEADPDFGLCEIEEQLPQPFHYIHLQRDWGWNPKFQVRERLGAFERIAGTPLGIAGYIIHAELADQILGNHHRIEMPIDHFFDSLGRHSELFFRPVRPLVGIQAGLDSTIQVNQE